MGSIIKSAENVATVTGIEVSRPSAAIKIDGRSVDLSNILTRADLLLSDEVSVKVFLLFSLAFLTLVC